MRNGKAESALAKGKAESALAKGKAKAGDSTIVSLKPKNAFASRLVAAQNVLVREIVTASGSKRTLIKS